MIRLLWRTDIHCRDHSPSSRKDDWVETVARKLTEIGEIATKYDCDAVIDGGDFFDDKLPVRTPHRLVSRLARIHRAYPCPTWANVGNHDLRLSRLDNLPENPLETLYSTGVFNRLYDEHEFVMEKEGVKVRIVGVPYHGPRYDLARFKDIKRGDEDWLLCNAHVLASPEGGEMFKNEDILKYDELADLNPDIDCWMFGHWHKNQGITKVKGDKWVVNIGSLTRGSLTEDNTNREPGVAVMCFWPSTKGVPPSFEFVKITIEDAKDVFDMDKRAKEEARAMTVDAFVESVKEELQSSSDESFSKIVRDMQSIPDEIKQRALEYIDAASEG